MVEQVLAFSGLSAGYASRRVLSDVVLDIERCEWCSLLGPNASGKSTLLFCATGQLQPSAGTVHLSGYSLLIEPQLAKRHFGYAHAPDRLPALLTGLQCLEVYAAAHDL